MRRTIPAAALFMVTLGAALLAADNWPQWRGPELNGLSKEADLIRTGSPTTNIAWKLPTPSRTGSTPIIWGDIIFLSVATAEFTGDLELWAVDRHQQAVIWKKPLGSGNKAGRKQNMSTPSPVTDGRTVWVASPVVSGGIVIAPTRVQPMLAIDVAKRGGQKPKTLWSFDQGPDVPTPATDGTLRYIVRDNGAAFALDLKTGAVVYGPERLPPGAYSGSPVVADGHVYVTSEEGLTSVYKPVRRSSLSQKTRSTTTASARSRSRKDRSSSGPQSTCG